MEQTNEQVRLVNVDTDNFEALIKLTVNDDQKNFVASNIYSLAEAYATNAEANFAKPFGIYVGEKPVGFLMIGYNEAGIEENAPQILKNNYSLWRIMIDKNHQGKGFGREAMEEDARK